MVWYGIVEFNVSLDTQRDRSRVTTRMHVPGPLFGDFFYTDRAEI